MIFFLDQMYPVGFDIIGLKISLSEAVRLLRLILLGEIMAKAFCLCSTMLPAWSFLLYWTTGHSCVPTVCSDQKEACYVESGMRNKNVMLRAHYKTILGGELFFFFKEHTKV